MIAAFGGAYLITTVPLLPQAPRRDWLLWPADILTVAGLAFTLWSLLYLRRSFSIVPQARRLVTSGPYRLCRNPLYVGEVIGGWAAFLPAIGPIGALVLATSLGFQLVRVSAEEQVLARSFGDEYLDYCRRVPRFFPSPRRLRGDDAMTSKRRRANRGPVAASWRACAVAIEGAVRVVFVLVQTLRSKEAR
jgi:protein-S-isoprenylcysteine O-methyltransferase Ste14